MLTLGIQFIKVTVLTITSTIPAYVIMKSHPIKKHFVCRSTVTFIYKLNCFLRG